MNIERNVFFSHRYNWPSSRMRGKQIADYLRKLGYLTRYINENNIMRIMPSESIIVFIKFYPDRILEKLKRKNNILVYDAIDFKNPSRLEFFDAVIAGNRVSEQILKGMCSHDTKVELIYHHADPYIEPNICDEREMKMAYLGTKANSNFLSDIPELNRICPEESNWRSRIRNYNTHFSARLNERKSVVKLANACKSKAVFLTGKEPGCLELLGSEYPYYIDDVEDLDQVKNRIEYVKDTIGTEIWRQAKSIMDSIACRLEINMSAKEYISLFEQIENK